MHLEGEYFRAVFEPENRTQLHGRITNGLVGRISTGNGRERRLKRGLQILFIDPCKLSLYLIGYSKTAGQHQPRNRT